MAITEFGLVPPVTKLTFDATNGRSTPHGYTVAKLSAAAPTAVTFNATARTGIDTVDGDTTSTSVQQPSRLAQRDVHALCSRDAGTARPRLLLLVAQGEVDAGRVRRRHSAPSPPTTR